jgi:hypothetical protein
MSSGIESLTTEELQEEYGTLLHAKMKGLTRR